MARNKLHAQPAIRKRTPTDKQLDQQARFTEVVSFETTMTGLLETSFKNYANKMSGYNSALSYNIKNAITGSYPNYTIDYSVALISRGKLPNAIAPAASVTGETVYFTWTDNSGTADARPDDAAILLVYCEALKTSLYTLNGGTRSAGAGNMDVTMFKGNTVQTWVGFISADSALVANSFYTGQLTIS